MHFVCPDPAFELRSAEPVDRLPLQRMLELYQHDLSDVWDQDLDARGEYGYPLEGYWQGQGSQAFVVLVESRYAGFALVVPRPRLPGGEHWLEQFFIVKKYRRRGIGRAVAFALFDAMPGVWQVGQFPELLRAQKFWRDAIRSYTHAEVDEAKVPTAEGLSTVQTFCSRTPPDALPARVPAAPVAASDRLERLEA